jgi:hypothetical protein
MLSMLGRDQAIVASIMEDMQTLLADPTGAKQSDIDRARWQLDRIVDRHIHTLKNDVVRWSEVNKPLFAERARGVGHMADDLRGSYSRHKERFPSGPTKETWADYKASASILMRALNRLFQAEKTEIFPLLAAE